MAASSVWPRQPFVGIALAAIAGIAVADAFPVVSSVAIGVVFCLATVALFIRKSAVTYLFVAAAFFLLHSLRVTDSPGQRLAREFGSEVRAASIRGFVVTEPKVSVTGISTFVVALETIDLDGTPEPTSAPMVVRWKHPVEYGDEIYVFGTVEAVPPPRNPGEFDMRAFLERQDVHRQLFVTYPENGRIVSHTSGNYWLRAAQRSRAWLHGVLCRGLEDSPDVEGLISGMVLGLRHQSPDDIEEPFQQTGTLHLFAVAGLHVGIIAQLLWILAKLARLPIKWATALIIPALLFYSAITGFHTSSVRAALMSAVLLSGFFVARKVFALNSLAVVATGILCWDSNELFSVGYQLSFSVVTAILLVAGPAFVFLRKKLAQDAFLPPALFSRMRRIGDSLSWYFARAASVSFAAWLGSLPLMFWYYHLVTPISLLANLAVVPVAFFVLAGALMSIICAPWIAPLSLIFNNANWALSRLILSLVHLFSLLPSGHLYLERLHWPTGTRLEITALDVGTGAAIHLRTRQQDWLVDAGARRDFHRTVREYLRSRGINRLDGLVLTHGDASHIGGAMDVLDVFRPRTLFDTAAEDRSTVHRQLRDFTSTAKLPLAIWKQDDHRPLGRGIECRVLFPPAGFKADSADDQALVLQLLVDGKSVALLMSDSGDATEQALLRWGLDLHSDMIIKGQHRSGISCSPGFLDAVQPHLIVATSREFPETERLKSDWLEMLHTRGIELMRQDQTGAVTIDVFEKRWNARAFLTPQIFRSATR